MEGENYHFFICRFSRILLMVKKDSFFWGVGEGGGASCGLSTDYVSSSLYCRLHHLTCDITAISGTFLFLLFL